MWLINTTSLELEHIIDPYDGNNEYAILSHTWGNGELSFQEWRSGIGREKSGFEKISQTCRLARESGYGYAWVDTVCINKESSAELSEAINSMWHWYRDAKVCYAYLSDISGGCPKLVDEGWGRQTQRFRRHDPRVDDYFKHDSDDEEAYDHEGWWNYDEEAVKTWRHLFSKSRWFTRGWALQELLASKKLLFVAQDWNFIGTNSRLIRTISATTGIDALALQDTSSLNRFVIARKMSWAAHRKTSRLEDRAYSLLGIFGINLPLLYGEGARAFTRLQEELLRTTMDHSLFIWEADYASLARRHHLGEKLDRLFAKSPDEFKIGKDIIPWYSRTAYTSYQLTNKGLHFDSIPLVECNGESFAILNCWSEHNPVGPFALTLSGRDNMSKSSQWSQVLREGDYWITPKRFVVRDDLAEFSHASEREIAVLRYPLDTYRAPLPFQGIPTSYTRKYKPDRLNQMAIVQSWLLEGRYI